RGARVPAPTSASDMRRMAPDVGRHDVRFHSVDAGRLPRRGVTHRREVPEQAVRCLGVAQLRERPGSPNGAVRVLAAVLPYAHGIGPYVPGVRAAAGEWRREEPDDAVLVIDKVLLGRGHA